MYVDASADLEAAEAIIMNAKTQRVGVCNAAETLLVHADVAQRFLVAAVTRLTTAGVTIHADEATRAIVDGQPSIDSDMIVDATEQDWGTEYLSMDLAVRVVADVDEAVEHIRRYSSGHTEGIVASDVATVRAFRSGIDAAAIAVNASTRFTDGGQLGLGAEVGISTQKLHARGPVGDRRADDDDVDLRGRRNDSPVSATNTQTEQASGEVAIEKTTEATAGATAAPASPQHPPRALRRRRAIGIMGGTFDPIHHGHLVAASEVMDVYGLDQVVFVPAAMQPFKAGRHVTSAEHRYLMTVIATASNPRFAVSRVDIDRGGRPTRSIRWRTCRSNTRSRTSTSLRVPTR